MTAPAYTTDLTTIDTAEATTNWAEPTATGWTGGGGQYQDVDYPYIQGSYAVLQACTKSGIAALLCNSGGAITLPTDGAYFIWQNFYSPGPVVLETYANGGLRVMIGSSLANFDSWDVGGNDTGRNPYGGWQCWAVSPSYAGGYDDRAGTGVGNGQYIGAAVNLVNGVGKGYPHNLDVCRWGRGDARFSGGDSGNGYAGLAGFQAINDSSSNRWGLIQKVPYGYLWKGLMSLGESDQATATRARNTNVATLTFAAAHKFKVGDIITVSGLGGSGYNLTAAVATVPSSTSLTYASSGTNESQTSDTGGLVGCVVDFRDSNKLVFVDDTRKVTSAFNRIEIKHASSRVDWTGISLICVSPSTTASKGQIAVVDDCDVNVDSCLFQDISTIVWDSLSTIVSSIFRRCGQVTQAGATITACTFDRSTATAALLLDDKTAVTNCDFVSSGTGHAVQGFSAAGSYDISDLTFSGYASSDGSSGNEAIYVTATEGTVTLNYSGTEPSVRSAGATVVKQTSQITLTIDGIVSGSDVVVLDAGTTTVLDDWQDIAGTSVQYIYGGGDVDDYIDIGVFKSGYRPLYVRGYQLGDDSTTLPVSQTIDRDYIE